MKKLLFVTFFLALHVMKSQSVSVVWSRFAEDNGIEQANSMAVDTDGNMYITGDFSGTVDFDPGQGVFNLTAIGTANIFILKLDANGNLAWVKSFPADPSDFACSLALDNAGNVFIQSNFSGTVDFDPGPATYTMSAGRTFLLKLDTDGNFVWAKQHDAHVPVGRVKLDASANIYMSGMYSVSSDLDPGPGVYTISPVPNSAYAFCIVKFNPSGDFIWAKSFDCSINVGEYFFVDPQGNVHATGRYSNVVDFDPGPGTFTLSAIDKTDAFILKLDSQGNLVYAKSIGGSGPDDGHSLGVDALGNVIATGSFSGTVDFDPGAGIFHLTTATGGINQYVVKLNTAGDFLWAQASGFNDLVLSFGIDEYANIYLPRYNRITKLNSAGNELWNFPFTLNNGRLSLSSPTEIYCTGNSGGSPPASPKVIMAKLAQPVGISEKFNPKHNIKLFPNPHNLDFNISLENNSKDAKLILFNTLGQAVLQQKITGGNNIISTPELKPGVYTYTIKNEEILIPGKLVKE